MRDVTPGNNKVDINKLVQFLIEYIKNPVQGISILPDWNWPSVLTIQVLLALASGVLSGLLKLNIYRMLYGLFIMPVVTTVCALLLALFLYYYFQLFENKTESYKKLFILVILSSIPFYVFQIISEYFAPITLIGFAFTSLIAVVGLCENFNVEKKRAYSIIGSLFVLVLIAWFTNRN